MSTKQGSVYGHRFHGDPNRFAVVAEYVADTFGKKVRFIADVAGGQGMLARMLNKKYNYECEVIDPRGFTLLGVKGRNEEYKVAMASYYDLIIGLHPDEALKDVVESGLTRPVIVIPCCNFWSSTEKLGRDALVEKIIAYYEEHKVTHERVEFDFAGPKNIGIVAWPNHSVS